MSVYARQAKAITSQCIPIERPFSNYDFIDAEFPGLLPLRRIMSQVRGHGGKTMVVETLGSAEDLHEENEDLQIRCPDFRASKARRLSFFTKEFVTKRGLHFATDDQFIGYAIVKSDFFGSSPAIHRIYESVTRLGRHDNNYVHGAPAWKCAVGEQSFRVSGYLYAQQNDKTNCCAHVALRTAAGRFHPRGDMTSREMNTLLGIDHVQKKVGEGGGLTNEEMCRVLEAAGARTFVGEYVKPSLAVQAPPFRKYLYGSIESGFPAIVFFATASQAYHTIPVFGHTFNEDTWVPAAESSYFRIGSGTAYIPSESWLSTFIAHDDNWGSNFCIPSRYLYTKRLCKKWPKGPKACVMESDCVAYVIATVPKEVLLSPLRAEVIGADYLSTILTALPTPGSQDKWLSRLRAYALTNRLVLRPILVDLQDYVRHLAKVRGWTDAPIRRSLIKTFRTFPDWKVWMIELSVPELFSLNRRKVGEVLLRSDREAGERDFRSFLFARLSGWFAFHEGGIAKPRYRFIPSGVGNHVELYGCEERA